MEGWRPRHKRLCVKGERRTERLIENLGLSVLLRDAVMIEYLSAGGWRTAELLNMELLLNVRLCRLTVDRGAQRLYSAEMGVAIKRTRKERAEGHVLESYRRQAVNAERL